MGQLLWSNKYIITVITFAYANANHFHPSLFNYCEQGMACEFFTASQFHPDLILNKTNGSTSNDLINTVLLYASLCVLITSILV